MERPNRFLALMKVGDEVLPCYLLNPGRIHKLLVPGAEVVLREDRKTSSDLIGVYYGEQLVSVDSRAPSRLVLEALKSKDMKEFSDYDFVKPEHGYGHSRFDFFLSGGGGRCLLDVRSCTLVVDDVALFPDDVALRGRVPVRL